jgi:hypothetical protein
MRRRRKMKKIRGNNREIKVRKGYIRRRGLKVGTKIERSR